MQAAPGAGLDIPIWILGSSTFGAQLAAYLGLPFAFASHFAPAQLEAALAYYRQGFRPSAQLDKPYVMLGVNTVAADTDAEARLLFSSSQQAFVNLRSGRPGKLPPPVEDYEATLEAHHRAVLADVLSLAVVGSADTVRAGLKAFAERHQADELMLTSMIFDHEARKKSYQLAIS